MRVIGSIIAVLLLSGCALSEDTITVNYVAPPNVNIAKGAKNVVLVVKGKDGRASNRDRVSSKKSGQGIETARIISKNDVVELVRNAVESELKSQGFNIGTGDLTVNVELQTFYNDFKLGFFTGSTVAEVAFNLTVLNSKGDFIYSRAYKGVNQVPHVMMSIGENAKSALEEALKKAMTQMIADQNLPKAIIKGANRSSARNADERLAQFTR